MLLGSVVIAGLLMFVVYVTLEYSSNTVALPSLLRLMSDLPQRFFSNPARPCHASRSLRSSSFSACFNPPKRSEMPWMDPPWRGSRCSQRCSQRSRQTKQRRRAIPLRSVGFVYPFGTGGNSPCGSILFCGWVLLA